MASAAIVIGLTGGIASGKSAVAALLRERGAAVVDADELARRVVAPGQPALAELVARFGDEILQPDGALDRKKLGALVFSDAGARADLGRITHPRIAQASQAEIAAAAASGAAIVFYEAALLVENGLHRNLDAVVVVAVPIEVQRARLIARDGLSPEAAEARIAAQLPLSEKLEAATWVIDNRNDPTALRGEVDRVLAAITARFGPLARRHPAGAAQPSAVPDDEAHADDEPDGAGPTRRRAPATGRATLVTGFPSAAARHLLEHLAAAPPATDLYVLASAGQAAAAQATLARLPHGGGARRQVLVGDPASLHFGLSAVEYRALADEVTLIQHLCEPTAAGGSATWQRHAVLAGTDAVLELARDARRPARVVHWSSALASGRTEGEVREAELPAAGPLPARLDLLRQAEHLVARAARELPVVVLRPTLVVGDSRTGEIDRDDAWHDGLYRLIERVARGAEPRAHRHTAHGLGRVAHALIARSPQARAPVHVVPIDFLAAAAHVLGGRDEAAGKTFHLTDPNPLSADELVELLVAQCATVAPRPASPRLAAVARWWRARAGDSDALPAWRGDVHYDTANARTLLAPLGMTCPSLRSYLPLLVQAVLASAAPPACSEDELADPLAP